MNKEDNEATPSSVASTATVTASPSNPSPPQVTQGVAGDTPTPPRSSEEEIELKPTPPPPQIPTAATPPSSATLGGPVSSIGGVNTPAGTTVITATPSMEEEAKVEYEEELLLKWDDHHKSFFELAEDLCHQEQFIDVTLSCGEHNFPAHKLVLSVCSPYFRHLFLRNPCKHPIVVLKDVHFKYMKLLLMYMYRGEVSVPQEDLHGLLKTARGLQIRGLVELERKREAEGFLASATGSPIKRPPSDIQDGASTTSCDLDSRGDRDDFSIDEVRSRLHGQLEIQPIAGSHGAHNPLRPPSNMPPWHTLNPPTGRTPPPAHTTTSSSKAFATSSSNDGTGTGSEGHHSDPDDPRNYRLPMKRGRETPNNGLDNHHWGDSNGRNHHEPSRASPLTSTVQAPPRSRSRPSSSSSAAASASNAALLAAAQAAGMPLSSLDPSDPMSSMNALLAAAQAHSGSGGGSSSSTSASLPTTLSSLLPPSSISASATSTSSPSAASSSGVPLTGGPPPTTTSGSNGQGVDLSQATAMANVSQLQLYYYMQKVAAAGMGNPKERKECPICNKTLYDRSTWNRHMRIHTGEKPYPCRFCGRRFRTNYNKLGHEKKCPDRHSRAIAQPQPVTGTGQTENVVYR